MEKLNLLNKSIDGEQFMIPVIIMRKKYINSGVNSVIKLIVKGINIPTQPDSHNITTFMLNLKPFQSS